MGNACCSIGHDAAVVVVRGDNDDNDKLKKEVTSTTKANAAKIESGTNTKSLLTGIIGDGDNVIVPKIPEPPPRASGRGNEGKERKYDDDITSSNRRKSDATIFFDAMDRFPSETDMLYPPTQSMRKLPINVNLQESNSFQLLLNPSIRQIYTESSTTSLVGGRQPSLAFVTEHLSEGTPGMQERGYPGELTESELQTCLEFREQLKKRDPVFKQMVTSMHPYEKEAFALCRFLRARNFVIDDVFTMLQEKNQPENWKAMKLKDPTFYKNFDTAVPEFNGCPLPVFMSQFPLIHTGIGKNGAIVVYFKAGKVKCPGVECIVGDITNALPFAWNRLYHGSRGAMEREIARSDPTTTTVLAEKIIIIDLEGDSSLFTSGMPFLRVAPTAGACFPETVNRTYILNAPFSFSIAWTLIKQIIEPRTVQKTGFFSTISKAKADFLKHLDSNELLSSYGGTGQSFDEIFAVRQREFAHKEGVVRYVVELLAMNGSEIGFDFDLSSDETVESIVVYSRSDNMCEVSIVDGNRNCIIDHKIISRKEATRSCANSSDGCQSNNNYAVQIATTDDFAADASDQFFVNAKGGTKGDFFLVAVSIAEKS